MAVKMHNVNNVSRTTCSSHDNKMPKKIHFFLSLFCHIYYSYYYYYYGFLFP